MAFWMGNRGSYVSPGSFNPPALPPPPDATAGSRVLLDPVAYIGDRREKNGTFAQAITRTGQAVGVSFWLADPPAAFHFRIPCPGVATATDLVIEKPRVVCSGRDLAVIRVVYKPGARPVESMLDFAVMDCDYLAYRARAHQPPSFDVLPNPKPRHFLTWEIGLLQLPASGNGGDDDGEFVMAVLCLADFEPMRYDLHVFSSKTNAWATRPAALDPPSLRHRDAILDHETGKVFALGGGGVLGWADLWRGVLLCDALDASPVVRYVPFPGPMAGNMEGFLKAPARTVRDVACGGGGVIRLVEIEDRRRLVAAAESNAAMMLGNWTTTESYVPAEGWTVVTWKRKLSSDRWVQDRTACVSGSSVVPPERRHVYSQISAQGSLEMAGPTWSVHGDEDVVYMMAKAGLKGETKALVITVDMRKSTVEGVTSFAAERDEFLELELRPFALSKYLDMAGPRKGVLQG